VVELEMNYMIGMEYFVVGKVVALVVAWVVVDNVVVALVVVDRVEVDKVVDIEVVWVVELIFELLVVQWVDSPYVLVEPIIEPEVVAQ
jgi:hypothetical protein